MEDVKFSKIETVSTQEAAIGFTIQNFISRFWLEAEKSHGARSDLFFEADGAFIIEGMVNAQGREAIRQVGAFREELGRQQQGDRHSRHLMSNFAFDLGAIPSEGRVTGRAVMMHFGGSGDLPLPLEKAFGIYDVRFDIASQADESWLFKQLEMRPVFVADNHPTRNMPRSFSHHGQE